MRDDNFTDVRPGSARGSQPLDQDEVDVVLTALRALSKQVSSPVIKVCLETARTDIAHLACPDGILEDQDTDDWEDDEFDDCDGANDSA